MDPDEFKSFVARLPFKPRILLGVDRYLELLDKAERKARQKSNSVKGEKWETI